MNYIKEAVKKRLIFFLINVFLCFIFIINYLNNTFLPLFIEYGEYQSVNITTKILNIAIEEQMNDLVKDQVVLKKEGDVDFNVEILNSVSCNIINRSQQILYALEKGYLDNEIIKKLNLNVGKEFLNKGVFFEVPVSMLLNNSLIGNLGVTIPVRYNLIGEIKGELISSIKEYGINNALIEIKLQINAKSKILVPLKTKEKEIIVSAPLIVKIIQGQIPDYYLGTQVIGGVK